MIQAAVVDANVAIKWLVPEKESDQARLLAHSKLEAPDLLVIECANILWKKVRSGDLTEAEANTDLDILLRAPVVLAATHELLSSALQLALDLKHPVYDCVYLALALQRGVPLITADRKLLNVVQKHKRLGIQIKLLAELSD